MRLQVSSIEGEYITQLIMGRTEPAPAAIAERADETADSRPVMELIENVATARLAVSRTAFSPDPEQRYLFVAGRSNQQVFSCSRGRRSRSLVATGRGSSTSCTT